MKLNSFSKIMMVGSIVFGAIFFFSLFFTGPDQGIFPKISFLISLFFLILCFFSLVLFLIKKRATNNEVVHLYIKSSARQAFLLAIFTLCALLLAMIELLTWWDVALLAFSLVLIELYFKSGKVVR